MDKYKKFEHEYIGSWYNCPLKGTECMIKPINDHYIDYGTNNNKAFTDKCGKTGKIHEWIWSSKISNCYNIYKCIKCNSVHRIDSSD